MKLLAYDIAHIKKYIFSGKHLKVVVGGSGLVREFEKYIKELFEKQGDCEVIYNGGGNGLIRVPDDADESVFKPITDKAREFGLEVDLSILDPNEFEMDSLGFFDEPPTNFGEIGKIMVKTGFALKRESQRLKKSRIIQLDPEKICKFCGKEEFKENHSEDHEAIEEEGEVCEKCRKRISFKHSLESETNLNIIGESPRGEKEENTYIALLYADGNSFGTVFEKLNDLSEYKQFSQTINDVVEEITTKVVKQHAKRFAKPILGGDDIFLFLPPSSALHVLEELHKSIEEALSKKLGEKTGKVDFSFALLIVPTTTPFLIEYEMANELLKNSKRERNKEGEGYFVAFQYASKFQPARSEPFENRNVKSALSVKEFFKLCDFARELSKAGINQNHMQRFEDILQEAESQLEKKINIAYFMSRALETQATNHGKLVKEYLNFVEKYDHRMFSDLFNFLLDFEG